MQTFDIGIIGAGPAGCSAALTLRNSNYSIAIFEKESYPRHKVCGDGVCDRSINTLKEISEDYYNEFMKFEKKLSIANTDLVYKNKVFTVNFKSFGYACKREHFDAFLFSLVKRDCTNMSIFQNTNIISVVKFENSFIIRSKTEEFSCKMLLICNGAKSLIANDLTDKKFDKNEHGIAVRAYYEGVTGCKLDTIELHYKKEYFPGYLWVFPLSNNQANVGFGYHVAHSKKHKKNIQDIMLEWIKNDPILSKRFANAKQMSSIQGGLIPYNTNSFDCSGDNYMICGDAASLIDPISGGGIGSAMLSGFYAAKQAEISVLTNDFSKNSTQQYELALTKRIKKEIALRNSVQKNITRFPWILDILAAIGSNRWIMNRIKKWYMV